MLTSISRTQLYVLDQDEALAFYTEALGFEVAADFDLGFMRWLTIRLPGQPGSEVLLERPGAPAMSDEIATQVADLVSKGSAGGSLFLTTDDARATHQALRDRGVDIVDEPTERPYGIDFGIRDPFGNPIRIGQMFDPSSAP